VEQDYKALLLSNGEGQSNSSNSRVIGNPYLGITSGFAVTWAQSPEGLM